MKNVIIQNPILVLALAFVVGWTVHWILGLLFFRSRYFEQEAQIAKQARDLEESRFNLGRTQTDLRSKSDLLEAVQRAKTAAEQKTQSLESDLHCVRGLMAIAQAEVLTHSAAAQAAQNRLTSETAQPFSGSPSSFDNSPDWHIRERDAAIATLQERAKHWENRSAELEAALKAAQGERIALQAGVATAQSVGQSLQTALGSRDSTISALKADLAQRESERESVANALSSADTERQRLKEQLETARLAQERELRLRTSLESLIKQREQQLAEFEIKAEQYQETFNEAAAENHRLSDESRRVSAQLSSSMASIKPLEQEIAALRTQLQSSRVATDSKNTGNAQLEKDLAARSQELSRIQEENRALREEMDSLLKANESLNEQLQVPSPTTEEAANPAPKPLHAQSSPLESRTTTESILADLDRVSRDRNELAAELASLKATLASLPASRKGSTRSANDPIEPRLL